MRIEEDKYMVSMRESNQDEDVINKYDMYEDTDNSELTIQIFGTQEMIGKIFVNSIEDMYSSDDQVDDEEQMYAIQRAEYIENH